MESSYLGIGCDTLRYHWICPRSKYYSPHGNPKYVKNCMTLGCTPWKRETIRYRTRHHWPHRPCAHTYRRCLGVNVCILETQSQKYPCSQSRPPALISRHPIRNWHSRCPSNQSMHGTAAQRRRDGSQHSHHAEFRDGNRRRGNEVHT